MIHPGASAGARYRDIQAASKGMDDGGGSTGNEWKEALLRENTNTHHQTALPKRDDVPELRPTARGRSTTPVL